jgi:hypothetical protein
MHTAGKIQMKTSLFIVGLAIMVIGCFINNFVRGESQQGQDDECINGPNSLLEFDEVAKGVGMESHVTDEQYNDAVRQDEIKIFIDENKEDLEIPIWLDTKIILCGIADDVQQKEKELGKTFEGKELESHIKIETMKTSVNALDSYVSED